MLSFRIRCLCGCCFSIYKEIRKWVFSCKLKVLESKIVTVRILKQANQTIKEAYLKSLRQEEEPVKFKSFSKTQNGMFFFNTSRGSTIERTNLLVSIMSSRRFQDVFSVTVFTLKTCWRRLQDQQMFAGSVNFSFDNKHFQNVSFIKTQKTGFLTF